MLPDYIHAGFYNLSAYLQAVALQAEHLCRQVEAHRLLQSRKAKGRLKAQVAVEPILQDVSAEGVTQAVFPPVLKTSLEETFGFKLTVRTITYILKRLDEFRAADQPQVFFQKIFTVNRLQEFRTIFREVLHRDAFAEKGKRNVDAINAVNFALFDEIQGRRVAQEGLKSVLRWRKDP